MRWLVTMVCLLTAVGVAWSDAPEEALCVVCASNGETELEKVAATRDFKGSTYYFCSTKCAESFDANPGAYVFETSAAPAAVWQTTAGEALTLESLRGNVVLLDFWATWCKPCVKSMPEMTKLYNDYRDKGLAVVGISVDQGDDRAKKVTKFLDKNPVGYPIVIDSQEASSWESFHVVALPTLYLIDRDGHILERWTGVVDLAAVRASVDRALAADAK